MKRPQKISNRSGLVDTVIADARLNPDMTILEFFAFVADKEGIGGEEDTSAVENLIGKISSADSPLRLYHFMDIKPPDFGANPELKEWRDDTALAVSYVLLRAEEKANKDGKPWEGLTLGQIRDEIGAEDRMSEWCIQQAVAEAQRKYIEKKSKSKGDDDESAGKGTRYQVNEGAKPAVEVLGRNPKVRALLGLEA